jgi:hypothetical protein
MNAEVPEIITGVRDDAQLLGCHDFIEAHDEFGTTDAT